MTTAVQECTTVEREARVVFGTPLRRTRGTRGPIVVFAPGCVVAYRIRQQRYWAGCVFRTAIDALAPGDIVPGVSPAPYLLFGFARGRIFERGLVLLRELRRRGIADALPNATYLRAATAITRPELDVRLLADTLEASSWTC
jgi:hypothetical protein